jgi:hypothetical protein
MHIYDEIERSYVRGRIDIEKIWLLPTIHIHMTVGDTGITI